MIRYEIVKHNENLFSVFSIVTSKGWDGSPKEFRNFVAEAKSENSAKFIVDALQ